MWHSFDTERIRIFPGDDGLFIVENPAKFSVLIRKIIASECCFLWTLDRAKHIPRVGNRAYLEIEDHGIKEFVCDTRLDPGERWTFPVGIMREGIRYVVTGKSKRINFFRREHIDIILYPGEPFTSED
jgi:hypothetical protein